MSKEKGNLKSNKKYLLEYRKSFVMVLWGVWILLATLFIYAYQSA